jgi:SAM-dependent methyltransferase
MPAEHTSNAIRRYYDQNTRLFLSLGSSAESQAIHRAVWGPGVRSLDESLNFSNALILNEIEAYAAGAGLPALRLVDLGCGVGGTLFYLLPRLTVAAQAVGLTLSPVQARLARRRAARLNMTPQCLFVEGDFIAAPLRGGVDVACSVEAYCHAVSAEAYFVQAARLLRPGGRLILCDDFLAARVFSGAERYWQAAYQRGWRVPNLHRLADVERWARAQQLRLKTLPDGLARAIWEVGRRLPVTHAIWPSMLGSMALQQCLHMGVVEYRFLVFAREAG